MTVRTSLITAPLAAAALVLTGCGAVTGSDDGSAAADGSPQVVAAFYPLQWAAQQVAGDRLEVTNLTTPGTEAHDLELGIGETAEISEADLVIFEAGFQPAVDSAVDENASGETLDAAEAVELLPFEESESHDHSHEEGDDHSHEEGEEHSHEEGDDHSHDHGDMDPHFWQDPMRMADLADAVAASLSEMDPDGADVYESNAADLRERLADLDTSYEDGLAECERDLVVVNHGAFGYLGKYGLEFDEITGVTPDAEPTPAARAELEELARDEGVTTIFSETLASPDAAQSLADDLGIEMRTLDPIEGLSDATADEDYLSLMRSNLTALRSANGC